MYDSNGNRNRYRFVIIFEDANTFEKPIKGNLTETEALVIPPIDLDVLNERGRNEVKD